MGGLLSKALKTFIHSDRARMKRFNRKADKVDKGYKDMTDAISRNPVGGVGLDLKAFAKKYE